MDHFDHPVALRFAKMAMVIGGLLAVCSPASADGDETADLVLTGGKIATVDSAFSFCEAIAIRENRILATGTVEEIRLLTGPKTSVIELNGAFAMPGMTDAHCHPFALGERGDEKSDWFDASGTQDYEDLVRRVKEHVKTLKPGTWIIGGGWNQEHWPGKQLPVHHPLSEVSPDNPLFLYRQGGNSAFANAKALEIAGIDRATPDPDGGKIHRLENGEPTGFVVNMGNNLIKAHFPKDSKPDSYYQDVYANASRLANEVGLTGWHDAGVGPGTIRVYKQLVDQQRLTVRANVMLQNPRLTTVEEMTGYFRRHRTVNYGGQHFLQVRSVKVFFDGAIGSRGARLFKPYLDDPDSTSNDGVYEVPPKYLADIALAGLRSGMQICPHAIGTRANHDLLTAFESALSKHPVDDHRFRSEHAELVHPQDVARFHELGVIPSVQPIHCTSDMAFMKSRIGTARSRSCASPWRSLIDQGCEPACGSDFMVESHRPLWGIYAAVTRKDHDGNPVEGWFGEQSMTREEAIRGYTIWAAKAAFLENEIGSIEPGKMADLVILDTDLLTCPEREIFLAKVMTTIVNGKVVYQAWGEK